MEKQGYTLPPTYRLSGEGCGCYGEPPGHPRYFTRSVYTSHGNNPPHGRPQYEYKGRYFTELEDVDKLFHPLPLEHERVQAWIAGSFRHMAHCYHDPDAKYGESAIYPVPDWRLRPFVDDKRFSDEWRAKERAVVEQANAEICAHDAALATPDNHSATLKVRRHYPEFQPTAELIDNPPEHGGDWWARMETRPAPEDCPGDAGLRTQHPVNGSWCQVCGWREPVTV